MAGGMGVVWLDGTGAGAAQWECWECEVRNVVTGGAGPGQWRVARA